MSSSQLDDALNNQEAKTFLPTQLFLTAVVVISIVSIILETVKSLDAWSTWFTVIEWSAVSIFSVEYIARLSTSKRKLGYIFSFWGLIDLISILPTFLKLGNLTFLKSVRTLRILRLQRILRLAKISRTYVSSQSKDESPKGITRLTLGIYFIALASSTVTFGALLYVVAQKEPAYSNIPLAMVQSAKILVGGLGQATVPSTLGDIVVIITRLVGLALFGLLIGIIGVTLNDLLFGHHDKK